MSTDRNLKATIWSFCERIASDFKDISSKLKELHPEWSEKYLAINLMEFGRGQVSEIDKPEKSDLQAAVQYVDSLDFGNKEVALFAAYAGGCIMGLVQTKQVSPSDFVEALEYSAEYSQREIR